MVFNKIKKFIAMGLVLSLVTPAINVQALDTEKKTNDTLQSESLVEENEENSEVIKDEAQEGATDIEEAIEKDSTEKENLESSNEEESKVLDGNVEVLDNNLEVLDENLETKENPSVKEEVKPEESSEENSSKKIDEEKKKEDKNDLDENELKGKVYKKRKIGVNQSSNNARILGVSMFSNNSNSSAINEPEEYKLKREQLENLEVLVNMTDKNYELTIANADGSYEFVEGYDKLEEAKAASTKLADSKVLGVSQQAAVINNSGEVVYTNFVMGRMIIFKNNVPSYSGNIDLYPTSDLTGAFNYTNVGYMEDVPVLEMTNKAAKIMVNGYIGWIRNDINSGTYNMKLIPRNQVKNPSYYTVKNGDLVHFISTNMEVSNGGGTSLVIGKAPSYLKEGVKYLSYDGNYFYEYSDSNIDSKLNSLIGEYRTGSRMSSVNRSEAFYNYYQYLSFRSKTKYTASDLDRFINNNTVSTSKLRGLGTALKNAESKYGVNALIMLGVAMNESGLGTSNYAISRNNLFGIAAFDADPNQATTFKTPGDSVLEFAKNYISGGYSDPSDWRYYGGFVGNKHRGVNIKYASDPYWGEKAAKHAYSIDKYLSGGNSNLKDTNSNFIGMVRGNSVVIDKSGKELYKISNSLKDYTSYSEIPFVINDIQKVVINNKEYYEINPEITNPLYTGSKMNDFDGNYNWNVKGYVLASDVTALNVYRPGYNKIFGQTRYQTSIELSKQNFTKSDYVVLVNGDAIIDGVSATPLATALNAPILLTYANHFTDELKNEMKRLGATKVIAVGGTGVISNNVLTKISQAGIKSVTRVGGDTRYDTSLEIAKYIDKNIYKLENIVVAAGDGEADALSISSVAGEKKMPIILTNINGPNEKIKTWLKSKNINNAYIIGGTGVISNKGLQEINSITAQDISKNRLGGSDRYETNAKVIEKFYGNQLSKVYITVGSPLADSLSAGVVAALNKSPLVITKYDIQTSQKNVLKNKSTSQVIQVGGTVSDKAINTVRDLLSSKK